MTRKARWSERWVVEPDPSHDPWTCAMRHQDSVIVEWSMIITFHDATILPLNLPHPFTKHTNNTKPPNCRCRYYTQQVPTTLRRAPPRQNSDNHHTNTHAHADALMPIAPTFLRTKDVLHPTNPTSTHHTSTSSAKTFSTSFHPSIASAYFLAHRY